MTPQPHHQADPAISAEFELQALGEIAQLAAQKPRRVRIPAAQALDWQRLLDLGYIEGRIYHGQVEDGGTLARFTGLTQEGARHLQQLQSRQAEQKPARRLQRSLLSSLGWVAVYLAGCATPAVSDWIARHLRAWLP